MIITKKYINLKIDEMEIGNDYYFEEEKLNIRLEGNILKITDITNSLRWGKTCPRIVLKFSEELNNDTLISLNRLVKKYSLKLNNLLDLHILETLKLDLKSIYDIEMIIVNTEIKGVNTYSPFAKIDKKKATIPEKRFGRWHLIKFIMSGQSDITDQEIIKQIVETEAKNQKTQVEEVIDNEALIVYTNKNIEVIITVSREEDEEEAQLKVA